MDVNIVRKLEPSIFKFIKLNANIQNVERVKSKELRKWHKDKEKNPEAPEPT